MSEELSVEWDPWKLPSPQHRAGLAGFVLAARRLDSLNPGPGLMEVSYARGPNGHVVRATMDRRGLSRLLALLYECKWVAELADEDDGGEEVAPEGEPAKPKRTKKAQRAKQAEPAKPSLWATLRVLDGFDPSDGGLWHRLAVRSLWRYVRRSGPARYRYSDQVSPPEKNQGGKGPLWQTANTPIDPGVEAEWGMLTVPHAPVCLSGSLRLGIEAKSAEGRAISDRGDRAFLLPFAHLVFSWRPVGAYYNPTTDRLSLSSMAVAVPDVRDVHAFLTAWVERQLARPTLEHPVFRGYPASAVVFDPREAALDSVMDGTAGYEVHHLVRDGNRLLVRSVRRGRASQESPRPRWSPIARSHEVDRVLGVGDEEARAAALLGRLRLDPRAWARSTAVDHDLDAMARELVADEEPSHPDAKEDPVVTEDEKQELSELERLPGGITMERILSRQVWYFLCGRTDWTNKVKYKRWRSDAERSEFYAKHSRTAKSESDALRSCSGTKRLDQFLARIFRNSAYCGERGMLVILDARKNSPESLKLNIICFLQTHIQRKA